MPRIRDILLTPQYRLSGHTLPRHEKYNLFVAKHGRAYWDDCMIWRARIITILSILLTIAAVGGFLLLPRPYNAFWLQGSSVVGCLGFFGIKILEMKSS